MSSRTIKRAEALLQEQYDARMKIGGVTSDQAAALQGNSGTPNDTNRYLTALDSANLVTGPASAVDNNLAQFNGITGKIIEDSGLSNTNVASAISLKHTQGSDTALGAVGTKNPPIDADKAIYRDSTASDVLVTSTWTQVKAFLKTYFDTLYGTLASSHTQGTDTALGAMAEDIDMNSLYQLVSLAAPAANGEAIRATAKITEALLESATDLKHAAATVTDSTTIDFTLSTQEVTGSVKNYWTSATEVADDGTVALPTVTANYPAHGWVQVTTTTTIVESAEFEMGSDGNVSLIRATANVVVNADTDGKFCLGTAAGQNPLTVKNRLNGARQVLITLFYA